ncbi:MAG: class I SAM-dependent methyltransferase, partial [Planctomycetes bacterium]|nr:class I SAM-dependent methyltransferase [Planctomycetota bacterium]
MISDRLLSLARCPDCRGVLGGTPREVVCKACGRTVARTDAYLDLRPREAFAEQTKYLDESLHADARHESVSPPLLSAGVRNSMLRAFLTAGPDDRVIDLGCGSGRALIWNRDRGAYQVGVDVSPFFAEEAQARVDLALGDLRRLPFGDAAFSRAYALDVLEHLSREALVEMLREAARVLEPGGCLFVYSHVRRNSALAGGLRAINALARQLERMGWIDLSRERLRKSDHLNPLADIEDLEQVVSGAGFRVAKLRYYTPLIGGVVENILMRVVEQGLARRLARRSRRVAAPGGEAIARTAGARAARAEAKRRIAGRGPTYVALRVLTWLMKLDVVLF